MAEIDISFFKTLVMSEVENYELHDYVKDMYFESLGSDIAGVYRYIEDKKRGYIVISSDYVKLKKFQIIDSISMVDSYFEILKSIYHELCHAIQRKYMDIHSDYRSYLYSTCLYYFVRDIEKYMKNYFCMPNEKEANFFGIYKASETIMKLFPLLRDYYDKTHILNKIMVQFLFDEYEEKLFCSYIIAPIEKNRLFFLKEDGDDFSRIDRLILGLPVNRDDYFHVKGNVLNSRLDKEIKNYALIKK